MKILIYDGLDPVMTPEDMAMIQALYSRDPRSVTIHVEKVKEEGPGQFMSQFYVGYGHKSIGDCGSTTIFVENVSMLVRKRFKIGRFIPDRKRVRATLICQSRKCAIRL